MPESEVHRPHGGMTVIIAIQPEKNFTQSAMFGKGAWRKTLEHKLGHLQKLMALSTKSDYCTAAF